MVFLAKLSEGRAALGLWTQSKFLPDKNKLVELVPSQSEASYSDVREGFELDGAD